MSKITPTLTLSILLLLIISVTLASSEIDTSKIGVADGDEFTFTVTNYNVDESFDMGDGMDMKKGDTIKVTVDDATLSTTNGISITIKMGDTTETEDNIMDEFGSFAVFTDWDYWEANSSNLGIIDIEDMVGATPEFLISNGDTLFEVESSVSFEFPTEYAALIGYKSWDISAFLSYEKETGVIEKMDTEWELTLDDDSTEKMRMTFERGSGSDGPSIPGFGFYVSIVTLSLVALPLIRKRRL
ncbi:MAG: hypothetical protein ACXAD7_00475 [Candidatus Kariarchaeaceae archaeon]|jgi:hypothetical protein